MDDGSELKPPREEYCVPSEAVMPPCLSDVALGVTGAMAVLEVMSAISCKTKETDK